MKGEPPVKPRASPFLFPRFSAIFPQNGKNRIYESNSPRDTGSMINLDKMINTYLALIISKQDVGVPFGILIPYLLSMACVISL